MSILGNLIFPADNPWNQRITDAPVASNSAAIINNALAVYGNGNLRPDLAADDNTSAPIYGIPYNVVHGNSVNKVNFVLDSYKSESDIAPVPMPASVVIEGDRRNGPAPKGGRGDSHLLIYDVDNNVGYELYSASRPTENPDGKWHAAHLAVWDYKKNTFRTLGWTSSDAAGLPILPGLVMPDEVIQQGVIKHAIRVTMNGDLVLNQFIYPASHKTTTGGNDAVKLMPLGTRLRLKASVNIANMPPQSKVIAQALKDYGMIVADNGGNFFLTGAPNAVDANNKDVLSWNNADIHDSVKGVRSLRYADFEVVDLMPRINGLTPSSGNPGDVVEVKGINFGGAAGRLEAWFGGAKGTDLQVVSDTQLKVRVPARPANATLTPDVRVQSGVNVANLPGNAKGNVWGYGISAVVPAGKFTYGSSPAPQVVKLVPAIESISPDGKTFVLAVTAKDQSGNVVTTHDKTAVLGGVVRSRLVSGVAKFVFSITEED